MTKEEKFTNDIRVTHPLGKGEVVSSILTGSTRNAHELRASDARDLPNSATHDGTKHEDDASIRGKSVESVHQEFVAWCRPRLGAWPPLVVCAAGRVRMSLDICARYPERSSFVRMLADDVAQLEAAITDAS